MTSILFDQYTERLRRQQRSPHTVSAFATIARRLDDWLAQRGETAETASYALLEEYFDEMPLAPNSRGTHLRLVQAAYNYAVKRGTIRHNPVIDIKVVVPPDSEPRIIPMDTLRAMRDSITLPRDWVWFHLLAYTGMRRAEARGLRWEDGVRLEDQTIRVIGKGGKLRLIPIHPALGEVLVRERQAAGFVVPSTGSGGVAAQTIQEMTKRLSPVYTPHDFRRTVASSLALNGVDDPLIDRILGWAPRAVGRRYYINVATPELQRAILRLYADDPLV